MPAAEPLHIGNLIKQHLTNQERSVAWLADKVRCHRTTLARMLQKQSLDSEVLYRISIALGVNFHAIYSRKVEELMCKNAAT